jgi:uncharacterized protein (DUF58 family)
MSQTTGSKVELHASSDSTLPRRIVVFDHAPETFVVASMPAALRIPPRGRVTLAYHVLPTRRGSFTFGGLDQRILSPWGLWWREVHVPLESPVRVFPDFRHVLERGLLARHPRSRAQGLHVVRQRGQGTEFHELRDYQSGDAPRQIDWRATSRARRLISRQYQDESNQQLILVVDCGRRMHAQDRGVSHLDRALGAALHLAYVALRRGDAVGMATVGESSRWLPPRRGSAAMRSFLHLLYDVESSSQPSDLAVSLHEGLARVQRRSLVVLISNLRDERDDELVRTLSLATRRHLVLLASLRESVIGDMLAEPVHSFRDAVRFGAIHQYLRTRRRAHRRLERAGILHLDTEPQALSADLVSRYLAIKAAGTL